MGKKSLLLLSSFIIFFSSCYRRAYYVSPFHTNNHPYRTIPLQSGPVASSTYASASLSGGRSNEDFSDGVGAFQTSLYRSNNFGNFQGYYGLTTTLGIYDVEPIKSRVHHVVDTMLINRLSGTKFFGGIGAIGGINILVPLNKGEWRAFQLESSIQREFGEYQKFRDILGDTSANHVAHSKFFATLSFGTDVIGKLKNGSVGYKINFVTDTKRVFGTAREAKRSWIRLGALMQTLHYTHKNHTTFAQFNAGTHAVTFQIGMNYRLH